MARAKKRAELTAEEKLAAALVPEAEQPYKVPENWCWVRAVSLVKPMESTGPQGDRFQYIDIDAIDNSKQRVSTVKTVLSRNAPSRARRKLHAGDTIFSLVRPYLKNIAYIDGEHADCIASTGFFVCTPQACLDDRYLYNLMCSRYVVDGLTKYMKGDNSPSIRKDNLESFPLPFPPLPEQRRIVERVEGLFAKLDEAESKLRDILAQSETRRTAILHEAFSSRIVGVEMNLDEVCCSIYDGDHMPPPKADEGVPFLVISDVKGGTPSFQNARFVPSDYYDSLTETRKPKRGDVLYTLVGSYGIPVIVNTDRCFCFQRHMALLKPRAEYVTTDYLRYLLASPQAYELATNIATGTAQLTVPIRGLRKLRFRFPPLAEQNVIVRRLDALFAKQDSADARVNDALSAIATLRQTILARALRGELGTNDPTEESSVALLSEVL